MPIQSQDSSNLSNVMQQLEAHADDLRTFRDTPSANLTLAQVIANAKVQNSYLLALYRIATNNFGGTS